MGMGERGVAGRGGNCNIFMASLTFFTTKLIQFSLSPNLVNHLLLFFYLEIFHFELEILIFFIKEFCTEFCHWKMNSVKITIKMKHKLFLESAHVRVTIFLPCINYILQWGVCDCNLILKFEVKQKFLIFILIFQW